MKVNSEQAWALKAAGFPAPFLTLRGKWTKPGKDGTKAYRPGLSELIDACGDEFHGLIKIDEDMLKHFNFLPWEALAKVGGDTIAGYGNTREEALTKLLLRKGIDNGNN